MSQERYTYEVDRQLEEDEYQAHMRNFYALMGQKNEEYEKWLEAVQDANCENNGMKYDDA